MDTTNIIAVIILAATGFLIFFGTRGRLFTKPAPKAKSGPSATTTAGASGGAAATTAIPPIPPGSPAPPTPAPVVIAASPRSYSWLLWWVLIIVVVAYGGRWIWHETQNVSQTAPPRVNAPKKELRQYKKIFPLKFLGAENIVERRAGWVKIQKERGRANFYVRNIPIIPGAKYKIYFHSKRNTTGLDWLEINAGKGNGAPFCYKTHPASDYSIETIFFEEGMGGEEKYFYPRDNFLRLWADDELTVRLDKQPYVEITYWE